MLPLGRALVRIAFAMLVLLCGTFTIRAQTCEPPVAAPQINAPVEVCPYTPATASIAPPAEGTWQGVWWSITSGSFVDENGTPVEYPTGETVRFTANGTGPVTLYATAQASSGCYAEGGQAQVPLRTIAAPQLSVPVEVCPYTPVTASVLPPAEGTWQGVWWNIINGTFVDENGSPVQYPSGESVRFTANGSGPVTLYVNALDSFGCYAEGGQAQVPLRTIAAPQLTVPEAVCPYTPATASVLPPAEGTWQGVWWSIANGTFVDENGSPVQYPSGESVRFTANSSGPVTLYANALDSFGCYAEGGQAEVAIQTIAPPQISAPSQVCTYARATANVLPPAQGSWESVWWNITGGSFVDANGNPVQYPEGETVWFVALSTGTVTLNASAQDSSGCYAQGGTITIPTVEGDGTPPPSIVFSTTEICGTGPYTAGVESLYNSYAWSIGNGTITAGDGTSSITFVANGEGPVTVSVLTNAATCAMPDSKTLPLRATNPAYFIAPSSACPGSLQKAWAPYWFSNLQWTATNATIEGPSDGDTIFFRSTGAGPVVVTLRAIDSQGCFASESVTIPVGAYPAPVFIYPQGESMCPGGWLTVQASDVHPSYEWTLTNATDITGQGTPLVNFQHVAGAGDVVITLDVGEGSCTASATTTVAVRAAVDVIAELAAPAVCANGTGTFYIDNYDSFSHVSIYVTHGTHIGTSLGRVPGGRTLTYRNDGSGDTTILIHADSYACLESAELTATMLPAATASISANGPTTFCEDGSVTLTANAGASYLWSNGATTQSIVVNASGAYGVTVTNENGCSKTSGATNVVVNTTPATPVITASGPTSFCEGGSVTLTAPGSASYLWSTGATSQSITVNASGAYSVTVTNANGCSATSTPLPVTMNVPAKPVVTVSKTHSCPGEPVMLTSTEAASYLWSTGETTRFITASPITFTQYWVDTTDANGCTLRSDAVTIYAGQPAKPTVSEQGNDPFCDGETVALVAMEYFPAHTYLWSTGETTRTIFAPAPGTYTVTAINPYGCASEPSDPIVLSAYEPTATVSGTDAICAGESTTIRADLTGAYPWNITWSDGFVQNGIVTSPALRVVSPAAATTYTIASVSDAFCNGSASGAAVVDIHPTPNVDIDVTQVDDGQGFGSILSSASGTVEVCGDPTIRLAPAVTDPNSMYAWSSGAMTATLDVRASGTYTLTMTDANGCTASSSVTIQYNDAASATITASGPTTFCEGGSVTLTAPAGGSYLWSNGAATQSIVVNASGAYSVTVTNANGCSATSAATNVVVNATPETPVVTASGPMTFCEGGSVTLTAPASASYFWSNGATTQSIVVNASGSYGVTITDANGCSATSAATNVVVNSNPEPPVIAASGPTTFCEGGSVTLTAPASASYVWSNGATTQSIVVTASGSYSVTVGSAGGCTATSAPTIVIVNPLPDVPVITASGSTSLCPGQDVTLTAPGGYSAYLWSDGGTSSSITVDSAGNYSVTVTNANGCQRTSAPVSVVSNPATAIDTHPASQTMSRWTTRELSVVAGGTSTLQYQWYEGASGDLSSPIAGQTGSTLTIGPYQKKGTYRYWVSVTSTGCPSSAANSNTATITVTN